MGKTITPPYALYLKTQGAVNTPMTWHGPATQKRLEDWVMSYARSLGIGGANQHISLQLGFMPLPIHAEIRVNRRHRPDFGKVVASWTAGTFQCFE